MAMKIYVENVRDYEAGKGNGKWITLPAPEDEIKEMLKDIRIDNLEKTNNYIITDFGATFEIGRFDTIKELNDVAERLEELDEIEMRAFAALLDNGIVEDYDEAFDALYNVHYYENCYDMADVAYQFYEDTGRLDKLKKYINPSYIDWEAIGLDMELNGTFLEIDNGCYIEYFG